MLVSLTGAVWQAVVSGLWLSVVTPVYASIGRGFHSADLRGVNQDVSVDLGLPHTPLLARQEGQELGVRSTPTFFINGKPLVGAQPVETFRAAIDGALRAAR